MDRLLRRRGWLALALLSLLPAAAAFAQGTVDPTAAPPGSKLDTGDTAWLLASTALVLLMTPGLALFYGGMVRRKNVLGTLMQSFVAMGVVTVLWVVIGYSLAFSQGGPVIGGIQWAFLNGVQVGTIFR